MSNNSLTSAIKPQKLKEIRVNLREGTKNNLEEIRLPDNTPARRSQSHTKNGNEILINQDNFGEIFAKNKNRNNIE